MKNFCQIKFIGTGEPMTIKQFNTCFALLDKNNECFLIDAGGGNGILKRLIDEKIDITQIKNVFLTHSHTDHILGALWLIRKIASLKVEYKCVFYMSKAVYDDFMALCNICVSGHMKKAEQRIEFRIVEHLENVMIGKNKVTFFDTYTKKVPQFACKIESNNKTIGFCGDIPLERENYKILENVDILIHEALCDSENGLKYNVYNRGHVTAKDAGKVAKELKVKKLILIHKADEYIKNNILKEDASKEFDGEIITANDSTIIEII